MTEIIKSKQFDLEDRTLRFAKNIRWFVKKLEKDISNIEDIKQLIRSSGSIGANYIEANESLSKKDFLMRLKISRKEAKESVFWLKLLNINNEETEALRNKLILESTEIMKIFGSIITKSEKGSFEINN
ncbi:MAG: four helix bundle protein [Bacteroidota bacterium]|nr:four helix bundle protein [Bacteroidota bacterium]